MGYLDSLNITGSALTAERFRTDIIMQNLANQNTTRTAEGGPYKRKQVVFRENTLNFKSELGKAMTKAEKGRPRRSLCGGSGGEPESFGAGL